MYRLVYKAYSEKVNDGGSGMLDDKLGGSNNIKHDYLYENDAEMTAFFKIPKILVENPKYLRMSVEAKFLYGCFLDRAALSKTNDWKDCKGRIYIIFQFEDIKRVLGCSNQKAGKVLIELEKEYDLIDRKKQGQGKPNLIYVKKILIEESEPKYQNYENQSIRSTKIEAAEVYKSEFKKYENHSSGSSEIELEELRKSNTNKTNINKTNISKTEFTSTDQELDELEKRRRYEEYFIDSLSIEQLIEEYPMKKEILYEILEVVLDTMCSNRKTIRVSKEDKAREVVYSKFMKLNINHIRYVLEVLENSSNVRNMKQYILTTLYNAALTINNYITVQHNSGCKKEEKKKTKDYFGYFGPETKNEELLNAILGNW